jgi:uncharacterized caspase-like protein
MQTISIRIFLVLLILVLINPYSLPAATEQRIALVIGNGAYSSGPLKNPVNDATAMAAQLQKLGFTVILKKNANLRGMEDALSDFGDRLKRGGVGLFFYAGHGLQVGGANYLVPIGARINREADIKYETLDAGKILDEMAIANNGLNIVIFDACRDNPYSRSFRNASRGLAIVSNAPAGTFISYSTSPGNVASDGDGKNSPYTEALLWYMKEPGLTIEQVFKGARARLGKDTGGKQIPWELSSLQGEFYFVPGSVRKATDITPSGKIVFDKTQSATYSLDDETKKLEDEDRNLEKEKLLLEKKKALEEKRQKIEAEKATLEAKKTTTLATAKPAVPDIIGVWKWSVRSALVPDRINIVKPDGECSLDGDSGQWSYDAEGRIFFYWKLWGNWTHKMTLSKDGLLLKGTDDWGTEVTGRKIK